MTRWTLVPPDTLDDSDWAEAETRGVVLHPYLDHGGRRFAAIVYDSYRLVQDARYVTGFEPFYEPNIVLVHGLTRESVQREGERLARLPHRDWLLDIGDAPDADWSLVAPDWTGITEHGVLRTSLGYGEKRFPVTFFDLERLAVAVGWDGFDGFLHQSREPRPVEFDEQNVIVLPVLTREAVEEAVVNLAGRREFDWLVGR